jgi:alpha-beta hydrolase superfamily lysophospholipase
VLNAHGDVVALPEYRRTGGGQGGWPQTGQDGKDALARVPDEIDEAAPGWIDPGRPMVVVGHSAGAHLGPWAALQAEPGRVSKIIALAPCFDLEFLSRTRHLNGFVDELLGGTPEEVPEAYREADVFSRVTGGVPLILVQGTEDLQLTVEMSRRAAARLKGVPSVSYVEVEDTDHFDPINPESKACVNVVIPMILEP